MKKLASEERQRRISEGQRLAWKRRKATSGVRLSRKQLVKISLYLKYIAFILEQGSAELVVQRVIRKRK